MQAREKRQGRERRTWTEIRFKVKAKDWLWQEGGGNILYPCLRSERGSQSKEGLWGSWLDNEGNHVSWSHILYEAWVGASAKGERSRWRGKKPWEPPSCAPFLPLQGSCAQRSASSPRVQENRQEWESVSPRALAQLRPETEARQQRTEPKRERDSHIDHVTERAERRGHFLQRVCLPCKAPGLEITGPGPESHNLKKL